MRAGMVARLLSPRGVSASALSNESGVSQATLSLWLKGSYRASGEQAQAATRTRPAAAEPTIGNAQGEATVRGQAGARGASGGRLEGVTARVI